MPDFSDTERRLIDLLEVGAKISAKNLVFQNKCSIFAPIYKTIGLWYM